MTWTLKERGEYLKSLYKKRDEYLIRAYVVDTMIDNFFEEIDRPREEWVDMYGCKRSAVHSMFPVRYDSTPFS